MSRTNKLTGVILAAGRGTRIRPLSLHYPKPLLPVCNKPIIQYQLEQLKRIGVDEVFIVVGHLKETVLKALGDGEALGMTLHYVDQGETLGIAHAVYKLEDQIQTPFMLFLGDILIHAPRLEQMVEMFWNRRAGGVLAVKREPDPEMIRRNFAVILHASGLVTRVIEKPRFANTNLKGCGIYLFDLPIFDAIRRTPRTAQRDEYEITNSIQILIDDGYPVYPAEVVEWDMNVTVAADVLEVNRVWRETLGVDQVIGRNVALHPEARLGRGAIVGDNVHIETPITVRDSVIFADSVVRSEWDLDHYVITPEDIIHCGPDGASGVVPA